MKRRFVDLTPLETLQAAIAIERHNSELVQDLTQTFASYDGKLGTLFATMAEEKINHRWDLEACLQRQFPGERPTSEVGARIDQAVEGPDLDEPEAFVFDNATAQPAIEMTECAETYAYDFYQTMPQEAGEEGLRALYQHMAEVEAQHRGTSLAGRNSSVAGQSCRTHSGDIP